MPGLELARQVHREVLSHFVWTPDTEVFGKLEYWSRPVSVDGLLRGDCDDFMLECYYRLRDLDYPKEDMHLAVCRTEDNQEDPGVSYDHAVLLVVADGKYYVLDNRFRRVYPFGRSGYDNWRMSTGNVSQGWAAII